MKTILFFVLAFAINAQAKSLELTMKPNSSLLADNQTYVTGEVMGSKPLCPGKKKCFLNGTRLKIRFELPSSCSGRLERLQYVSNFSGDKVQVKAVFTRNMKNEICPALLVYEDVTLDLVNVYKPFELAFLTEDITYVQ